MKLYLSSYRIPAQAELFELIGKDPADTTVAVIPNAKDYYAERARKFKIHETVNYLGELGMKSQVVDLRDYHNDSPGIYERIMDDDLIWLTGGNTFCLMERIHDSGFENALRRRLDEGAVYAGESAGAVVIGSSLRGVELADEKAFAEQVIWDGMRIIPEYVIPHFGSPAYGAATDEIVRLHGDQLTIEISDTQAYILDGIESRIVEAS